MSKSRNKSKSEVEHLRGEIRRLKAELKYCKRCMEQDVDDIDYDDAAPVEPIKDLCPECGKGIMVEHDFKFATLKKCSVCGHEERRKKQ